MKYKKLGNSSFEVSVIGQGTWAMGGDTFGDVDVGEAIRTIHAGMDMGINFIDTAAGYGFNGRSERVVGKALKGRRDKVILETKLGPGRYYSNILDEFAYFLCLSPQMIRISLEESLVRLGTDYIDIMMIHWPENNNPLEGAFEELLKMKDEGKIREIAVSNFNVDQLKLGRDIGKIVAAQLPLNLLNRASEKDGTFNFCRENNIGIVNYGSLGGGILTGKMEKPVTKGNEARSTFYTFYEEPLWSMCQELLKTLREIADGRGVSVAEVSLNWVLGYPGITSSLCGACRPEEIIENLKCVDWELTEEERKIIDQRYDEFFGTIDTNSSFGGQNTAYDE